MRTVFIIGSLLICSSVMAQESNATTSAELGASTRQWMDLQKTPAAQASDARPMPGEVAEQVYQRYVNSFKYPIPQQFARESFKGSGGGSQ